MNSDSRIAVVDQIENVEESQKPFGKRWRQEEITLTAGHLSALREGKFLALDVQSEYVIFSKLDPTLFTKDFDKFSLDLSLKSLKESRG